MTRLCIIVFFFASLTGSTALAQAGKAHSLRRQGDKKYDKKYFEEAEKDYRSSIVADPDLKGTFNLGNTILQQSRYEEAAKTYEKALGLTNDQEEKSKTWYNLGNAKYLQGDYGGSADAYKNALIIDPDDLQAKQNLLMALRELELQQQQQQQQQDQDRENQQSQNQPPTQEQDNQEEQNQQPQNSSSSEEQNLPPDQEQKLSKEQAEQLLKIIDEEDKKVQEKLRKKQAGEKKKAKDW